MTRQEWEDALPQEGPADFEALVQSRDQWVRVFDITIYTPADAPERGRFVKFKAEGLDHPMVSPGANYKLFRFLDMLVQGKARRLAVQTNSKCDDLI